MRGTLAGFRTLHLAQTDPRSFPFETVRGDQVVADSQVTTRGIQSFADQLAMHLLNKIHDRTIEEDGTERPALGLLGDYQPVADSYRPLTAPPIDQALVSFALSEYSLAPGVNVEVALRAREQAGRLLRDLHAAHQQDSAMLNDPTVAASIVYAATAYRGHSREDVAIAAIVSAAVDAISRIDAAEVRSAHARAMIAGAAARMLVRAHAATVRPRTGAGFAGQQCKMIGLQVAMRDLVGFAVERSGYAFALREIAGRNVHWFAALKRTARIGGHVFMADYRPVQPWPPIPAERR
jgi:hypothetical protein